jgi:hypothetical protein
MVDIVSYFNKRPQVGSDLNVAQHFDPGLISLNILSTLPGLQFLAGEEWIDIPQQSNMGVLWLGKWSYLRTSFFFLRGDFWIFSRAVRYSWIRGFWLPICFILIPRALLRFAWNLVEFFFFFSKNLISEFRRTRENVKPQSRSRSSSRPVRRRKTKF